MNKYRPPLTPAEINELNRLSSIDFSTYSEADVREEFLVELLKILGYRKEQDYSVSREDSYSLHPLFLSVGSSRIKLDYLCSLRKQYFWLIDAKKGKCTDKNNPAQINISEIEQAYFYSLHPEINCPYFIVSNGWYTNLYERNSLDKEATPLLSIKSSEIADRFLELDSYVGSTQILPYLKNEILKVIEKTLSAEIRIDRLDEFVKEVEKSISKVRPIVRENSKTLHLDKKRSYKDEEYENEDLYKIVNDTFQVPLSFLHLEHYSNKFLQRLNNDQIYSKQYLFFNKLCMDETRYVSYWYYSSVLYFLLFLKKNDFELNTKSFSKTFDDLLREWVDLCVFGLNDRSDLRAIYSFEALFYRFGKRTALMSNNTRKSISKMVQRSLYFLPEEEIAHYGPNSASMVIDMVTKFAQFSTERMLIKYMDRRTLNFKTTLALQEYSSLKVDLEKIEHATDEEFYKVESELGMEWSEVMFLDRMNRTFDPLGSAVCNVILSFVPLSLKYLNEEHIARLKIMAELGCTNYADKVLMEIGVEWDKDFTKNPDLESFRKKYFDPSVDQREFKIKAGL